MDRTCKQMVLTNWFRTLLGFGTFFYFISLFSCKTNSDHKTELSIIWENGKPIAIVVPFNPANTNSADKLKSELKVSGTNGDYISNSILGDWSITDDSIVFKPLIPLTRGFSYKILYKEKEIGGITIPLPNASIRAKVIGIYPSTDTVPENLLKIYVEFSKPMTEGNALDYFKLIKNGKDTLHQVFLDLQTELWNNDHTRLTIWLDPGRIKRDLIPNKELGNPLIKGNHYRFIVDSSLPDGEGITLGKNYQKDFIVATRDSIIPDTDKWNINPPAANTTDILKIDLKESLDYILLKNAIRVLDEKGKPVEGNFQPGDKETQLTFSPSSKWVKGNFYLEIESRLEDLAGNNLNHPFDRDITVKETKKPQPIYKRSFTIE